MAKLQRKSAKLFAENASAGIGGVAQFGSLAAGDPNYSKDPDIIQALTAYKNGWSDAVVGNKSPAIEDRNALDYLLSYQQAYIMQHGIPEWIATETYYTGSFASVGSALYVSKTDNNIGNDPSTDSTETNWIAFPTPQELADGLALKVNKSGDTMTGDLIMSGATVYNSASGTNYRVLDTRDIANNLEVDYSAMVSIPIVNDSTGVINVTSAGYFLVTVWQGNYAACHYYIYDKNDNLLWDQEQMAWNDSNTAWVPMSKGYKIKIDHANSSFIVYFVPLKVNNN